MTALEPTGLGVVRVPENRFALQAIRRLARSLTHVGRASTCFRPLMLTGPTGTGKSTLIRSLLSHVLESPFGLTTHSQPANDLDARPDDETDSPDDRFDLLRACDLLVIEDVQRLPARSTPWLVRLLDQRAARRLATIVTANVGPASLNALDRRLTSRLSAGLVVSIAPFSPESRMKVLRRAVKFRRLRLSADALDWLANQPTGGGLRPMLGTLDSLNVLHGGSPVKLTRERIEALLTEVPTTSLSVERIVAHVATTFRVKPKDVFGTSRLRSVMLPRQVAMWLTRHVLKLSLPAIGQAFGRDHSTVLHAVRKIEELRASDADLANTLTVLQGELR